MDENGKLAEWSIAAVLKTVEPRGSVGSNPTLSALSLALRGRLALAVRKWSEKPSWLKPIPLTSPDPIRLCMQLAPQPHASADSEMIGSKSHHSSAGRATDL